MMGRMGRPVGVQNKLNAGSEAYKRLVAEYGTRPVSQIARDLGVSRVACYAALQRARDRTHQPAPRITWTEIEDAVLICAMRAGESSSETAGRLRERGFDRSPSAVRGRIKYLRKRDGA